MQSTLVLSKSDGSIIKSTGLLAPQASSEEAEEQGLRGLAPETATEHNLEVNGQARRQTAEEAAKMVFAFVDSAKAFADGIEHGDEVKLLRMRTKKNEIVIVPGIAKSLAQQQKHTDTLDRYQISLGRVS